MADFLPQFPFYCGELWEKFEEYLKRAGFNIEILHLKPQFEAEPTGKPRLVLLRQKSSGYLQALIAYDNYLSEERAPRSQEAFFLIYGK